MPWTRASELDRAIVCPASTHLVRIRHKSEAARKAADWGTVIHDWKETGKWPDGRVYERRQRALDAAGVSRDMLWPADSGRHEVAFALHSKNRIVAQHVGTKEEREAWKQTCEAEWVTGTTDWWGDYLGVPWVDDLKTGKAEYLKKDPWDHWQLRFYALCAVMLTGADECMVSLTHWPQYPADGVPVRYWARAPREELLGMTLPLIEHARLNALRSKEVEVEPVVGPQCTFCDCAANCPAV